MFRILSYLRPHRAADAEAELEHSRELHVETRVVARRLAELHERNSFSDMIRDALVLGHGGRGTASGSSGRAH